MAWYDEFKEKIEDARERLGHLPPQSFEIVTAGSYYAEKRAKIVFNNEQAANVSDFDLMVWYDGNPCFGGTVRRTGKTPSAPHGMAHVTVYTD